MYDFGLFRFVRDQRRRSFRLEKLAGVAKWQTQRT